MSQQAAIPLLFEGLESRLGGIDRLPRGLWLWSLIHSHGSLQPRLEGIEGLRADLIAGRLSDRPHWPSPALAPGLKAVLEELELQRYCTGQADLTETLLRSLLWHLDLIVDYMDRGASEEQAIADALAAFGADWADRCGSMDELIAVFGDCGDMLKNTRWDMLRGLLRSGGWQEVVRIRRLLESLPELAEIIRQLGRAQVTDELDESRKMATPTMEQAMVAHTTVREVRVPDYPGETRGVRRSGRVSRMLPAEAMLLGHPRLRLIWHARHAERTLLTYEDEEVMPELVHDQAPAWRPNPEPRPDRRLEMGPMIVCVDTSGSMQGGAETVAKAVVLEAVRTAHGQKRPCHVFAFSGPEDVVEMEIGVDEPGLERLTQFMGQSFRGGTDICGPLGRAMEKLTDEAWQLADLLIASDGEFGATPELAALVEQAKERQGLRVQGVLIGDRETIGFLELADHIYWVRDWRRYGTSDSDSPVHSKSLTAMYFPGALRTPENRNGTVGGDAAAEAVKAGLHRGEKL